MKRGRTLVATTLALVVTSCDRTSEPIWTPPPVVQAAIEAGTLPTAEESRSWVALYDPGRAMNGYTVAFYRRRTPIVLDMNGRIVHAWPEVRAKSRLRLLPDGNLLTLDLGRSASEWTWDGERVWHFEEKGRTPHHDLIRLANGNTLLISMKRGQPADELLEIDRSGRVVWEWAAVDHLAHRFDRAPRKKRDITHMNSVQELPANRHFDAGDERFRPGNLLISARNLSLIVVLDRQTGEEVWAYGDGDAETLDFQHEALMIEPGSPGAGNIVLFDNGYRGVERYRSTEVLEIDPATSRTVWSYADPTFYSPTSGSEQPLVNGNLLVSSSRGGRVFELTRDGDAVWQWTPPYEPRRPQRVAYDYTPQLAALDRTAESTVRPPAGYLWVDRDVYRFARRGEVRTVRIAGEKRNILVNPDLCRRLILPAGAAAVVAYGLRPGPLLDAGHREAPTTYTLLHRDPERTTELFTDTLGTKLSGVDETWREHTIDLSALAGRSVELCVETTPGVDTPHVVDYAFWANVHISTGLELPESENSDDLDDLTPEELEARRDHLRTLGYVD